MNVEELSRNGRKLIIMTRKKRCKHPFAYMEARVLAMVCLLSSPQLGFLLHLLLRNPPL
jgi:hypothetical protein